ncbi:hypothetical protein LLS1_18460 [Leifsonia sp. LS1]|uniref:phage tail protein n=1 Tax=Leifsonia sp. LS1 TaxID=2828483 RepID=UPI001CFDC805|nr:hypothetical protein [Leifsonia sp. LS1]GIT80177.1 hypothetical protein LLS1_18460 [Leifsonia sp. LS1]
MAKGPGGKSVGRLSARIVPDASRFKADLKKTLDRIEKTTVLKIRMVLDGKDAMGEAERFRRKWQSDSDRSPIIVPAKVSDLDKTWAARLRSQVTAATKKIEATIPAGIDGEKMRADLQAQIEKINKSLKAKIPTDPEAAADFRHKVDELVRDIEKRTANIDVDVETLGATTHVKEFTRRRELPIDLKITQTSIAKAGSILASLSGARVAGDFVQNLSEKLQNLDRSLPKISAVILAVGAIGAAALSSVGGIFTLGSSLAALVGLLGPLPGLLGASLTGVVVLAVALSDAGTQLGSLSSVWTRLKSVISDNFWAKAKQPIIDFVQSTLPQLSAGLEGVSSSLGSWTASLADGFKKAFGDGVLANMLAKLQESISIAATGTDGFANAIATLGTFGANNLPRMAQWFADITKEFDAWLTRVEGDGSLDKWLNSAIDAAKLLWSSFGSIFDIFSGISSAAQAAGGGGLVTVQRVLAKIAEVVNGPAFQTTLATLFEGAAAGVDGLLTALGPLGNMLSALAPTLSSVMSSIGVMVGTVLSQIANELAKPEIQTAIMSLFNGIRDGIQGLLPALPALGTLFATVAQFAGVLAGQLGSVLGQAIQTLVPVVTELLTQLQPIVPVLGQELVTALIQVTPSFLQLAQALGPLLVQLLEIAANTLPLLAQNINQLVPVISFLIQVVTAILTPLQYWIAIGSNVTKVLTGVQTQAQFLSKALSGEFGPVLQWVAQNVPPVTDALKNGLGAAASFVGTAFSNVSGVIRGAINGIIAMVNGAIRAINSLSVTIPDWVPGIGGQKWGIHLPTIPSLASGADIQPTPGGTLIRVSEAGRPETVTDLGRTNALIELTSRLARAALGQGGSTSSPIFNISEVSDPNGTAMAVLRRLDALGA